MTQVKTFEINSLSPQHNYVYVPVLRESEVLPYYHHYMQKRKYASISDSLSISKYLLLSKSELRLEFVRQV